MKIDWSNPEQVQEYRRMLYQAERANPEKLEQFRKKRRERWRKDRSDPVKQIKIKEHNRKMRVKLRLDPKKKARKNALHRANLRANRRNPLKQIKIREKDRSLLRRLRHSIRESLRTRKTCKSAKTSILLGCSFPHFCNHIEKHFWTGMSWQNQSRWHLDHIRPCASFDLRDPAQQAACFHWSNWQPLWADDNLAKSDRLNWTPAESKHTQ